MASLRVRGLRCIHWAASMQSSALTGGEEAASHALIEKAELVEGVSGLIGSGHEHTGMRCFHSLLLADRPL